MYVNACHLSMPGSMLPAFLLHVYALASVQCTCVSVCRLHALFVNLHTDNYPSFSLSFLIAMYQISIKTPNRMSPFLKN
jgi:hypothetical protein